MPVIPLVNAVVIIVNNPVIIIHIAPKWLLFLHVLSLCNSFGRRILTQQSFTRTAMCQPGSHGDHWIKKNLKIRPRTILLQTVGSSALSTIEMRRHGRGQMPACRKSGNSNFRRIDTPFLTTAPYPLHRTQSIGHRYTIMLVRHPIFQYDTCNPLLHQPLRKFFTFISHSQISITTSRTNQNSLARIFSRIRMKNQQFCCTIVRNSALIIYRTVHFNAIILFYSLGP